MIRTEVSDWLEEAKEELKTAEQLYGLSRYAYTCFHAQQAVEKAFKAIILHIKKKVHRSHDLVELNSEVKETLKLDASLEAKLSELSAFYTQARYPNAGLRRPSIEIGREQAERSLNTAKGVIDAITKFFTSKV